MILTCGLLLLNWSGRWRGVLIGICFGLMVALLTDELAGWGLISDLLVGFFKLGVGHISVFPGLLNLAREVFALLAELIFEGVDNVLVSGGALPLDVAL